MMDTRPKSFRREQSVSLEYTPPKPSPTYQAKIGFLEDSRDLLYDQIIHVIVLLPLVRVGIEVEPGA